MRMNRGGQSVLIGQREVVRFRADDGSSPRTDKKTP